MRALVAFLVVTTYTAAASGEPKVYTKHGLHIGDGAISPTSPASNSLSVERSTEDTTDTCPTWFIPNTDGGCSFGNDLNGACVYELVNHTGKLEIYLSICYCMSYNKNANTVAGVSLYGCFQGVGSFPQGSFFYLIPPNVSKLNEMMCSYVNRDGQLCGSCKEGFAPPVYSYDLQCVQTSQCTHNSTWWKYIAVAFLPLTVFYIMVIIFRISATSPALNGFVLVSQIFSMPTHLRLFELYRDIEYVHNPWLVPISVYGIWNLDFFRTVYTPFCLHPDMTNIQALALDYIIAVYPLILITVTYLFVELHDWGFRPIVWLWRPFHRCFVRFRRQWDIRTSLIDAFATFFLLSYVKLLSVSFDLLFPVSITDVNGHTLSSMYLFLDATVEYFGKDHLPYGIVATVILVVFIICPVVLLCVYPCRCFQRCLNRCRFQCRVLHTFMDVFQGGYKDGTNGTRDCRYFAAVYLMVRIATFVLFALTLSYSYFYLASSLFIVLAMSVAIVQPYKSNTYNIVDSVLLLTPAFLYSSIMSFTVLHSQISLFNTNSVAIVFVCIALLVPLLYITRTVLHWILKKGWLIKILGSDVCLKFRRAQRAHSEESLPDRLIHAEAYLPP